MKPKKIIFIVNSLGQQRCIKRMEEFIENGYGIEAYGFVRKGTAVNIPEQLQVNVIGEFDNSLNYLKRILLMYRSIKQVLKNKITGGCICYYFMLDVALVSRLVCRIPYIYEESDLMHTYFRFKPWRYIFDLLDRHIIRKSVQTVMTSEGFAKYHFGENIPKNVSIITNRLNTKILELPEAHKTPPDIHRLRFAFIGVARYKSLLNFAGIILGRFPNHEFHFYGIPIDLQEQFYSLGRYPNGFFHGKFINPDELPAIYGHVDLVVSTYDAKYMNVRHLEPNKLYEAIFFRTPIIVSRNTFLADKVCSLNVGFAIDPMDENEVISFVNNLTAEDILEKQKSCAAIPKGDVVNINKGFFEKLDRILNKQANSNL